MRSFRVAIVLCLSLFYAIGSLANSEEHAEHGEKKEEAHGEGSERKFSQPEWVEVQNRVMQLEGKIQQKKEALTKLIEEKHHLPEDSPKIKEVISDMNKEYGELRTLTEDYDKQVTILKFRYPERGVKEGRKYEPIELKPMDEMERELGLDGRLTRNVQKARQQYGKSRGKSESTEGGPKSHQTNSPTSPASTEKPIDEQGVIIIKK